MTATTTEKSFSDHNDQMDTSPLTIPMIATIPATMIAGTGSDFIPAIAKIVNDRNDHTDMVQQSRTIRMIVIFPKVHCGSVSFHADFDFVPKHTKS